MTAEPATTSARVGVDLTNESRRLSTLLRSVWTERELLVILARKEFFARYRRASLGLLWAVFLPVLQATVLAVVFRAVFRFNVHSYPVYVYSGVVAWSFIQGALSAGSTAIVDGSPLSSKIYFPRAVLPLASVGANLYGFGINLVVLVAMMSVFGVVPGMHSLLLIPAVLLAVGLVTAASLTLSAAHVYFRDVRYIVQAVILLLFYLTPIIYPLGRLPASVQDLVRANPATGVVELMHAATASAGPHWTLAVAGSAGWLLFFMMTAAWAHTRYDRLFTDLL